MHAAYVVIPALGVLALAYRYYSAFLAAKVMCSTTRASTPAHTLQRRPELPPDAPLGAVRAPLRGDHRRRAAHRSGPRGAVRLCARPDLARRRRLPRRRRARHHHPVGLDAARRRVARRDRAHRRSVRSPAFTAPSPSSSSSSSRWPAWASRSSTRSSESAWGVFTIGMTIPLALLDGLVHVPACAPARSPRRRSSASPACSLAVIARQAGRGVVARRTTSCCRARS